ncbi:retrovirus-related pol polyprotein from transposon TNT 1-94 [Tanacetum coccineum]
MTGNRKLFSSYKAYNGGNVIFGSNLRSNIIGKGPISNDSLKIDNVKHVDNLRFNFLSVGKKSDNKCRVTFSEHDSEITKDGKVIGRGIRKKGLYVMKLGNKPEEKNCLATIDENSTLWHRRLGHAKMRLIQSLASNELVRNLPKLKFDQHFYDACKIRKHPHASHKAKNIVSTTRCLELLQMDLFGPSAIRSYKGNRYTLVIVDDYSTYTWTRFLKDKTESFDQFEIFSKKIQNQLGCTIVLIRTDHGREFDNEVKFGEFCNANGRKPALDYFRVFGSKCFILNTKDYLTKFERKSYESVFLGYSQNSKAYIILNKHTRKIKESLNITFDETPPPSKTSPLVDNVLDEEEAIKVAKKKILENDIEDETLDIDEVVNIKESRNHPLENVIGNLKQRTLRLVAQGYNQQEGIDCDETYAPVARLESIRILLAYACALDFRLFQIDVKSAFLNYFINEEVYVAQPPGFIDSEKSDHVYKLKKALYGLKQAPKAWYDRLKAFLIKHEYKMRMVDNTLFTKKKSSNLIIVQIYVDDIIFSSTCQDMCDEFAKIMHDEFEMSMMGELNLFLRLQIKQMEDGIFFNQSKYIKEMLKKFGLEDSKPMKTPISSDTKLMNDEDTKYRGMIGSLLYLTASRLDSKRLPKPLTLKRLSQTALAISTTEAEYVSARKASQQALWMKQALIDYDVRLDDVPIMCDNKEFGQILGIPYKGACVFTDKWSLDDLQYDVPTVGPYQTNPPCPDDIKNYIKVERKGPVTRIRHRAEIPVEENETLTREIMSTMKPCVEIIRENVFCLEGAKDSKGYGTKRGRHSTSSSSTFDQPSSSHLNDDDDDDGNDEGTSRASTPSPTRFVNSLTNEVP